MQPSYTYKAVITKVVDGDTIDFLVDLGFTVKVAIRTRLLGIDTPEVTTPEGRGVRDLLRGLLPAGTPVVITTFKDPNDKYGRWLAEVWPPAGDRFPAGVSLNAWLVSNGFAKQYGGGKKES